MTKAADLLGVRFDKLIVVRDVGRTDRGNVIWEARCDCGTVVRRTTHALRRCAKTGCLSCVQSERGFKHGGVGSQLYVLWKGTRQRCSNKNHIAFQYYGAKGIHVCEEWNTYEHFRDWAMPNGYKPGLTIDRINSSGNYEPKNCRWMTASENTARRNKEQSSLFRDYASMAAGIKRIIAAI